jgi:hypothetical protein
MDIPTALAGAKVFWNTIKAARSALSDGKDATIEATRAERDFAYAQLTFAEKLFTDLQGDLTAASERTAALEAEVSRLEKQTRAGQKPGIQAKALLILRALNTHGPFMSFNRLSGATGMRQDEVQYYVDDLHDNKMVARRAASFGTNDGEGGAYLEPKGRKAVFENPI